MKSRTLNQAGFGHVALLLVFVFLGIAGFAGYKVVAGHKDATASITTVTASAKAPTTISTKADLVQASKALDSSSAQVDSSMNDNALNGDLNDML